MSIVIPFAGFASFTEEVTLDNVPYRITFNWNERGQFWTCTIADRDDVILYAGIKIVLDYEMIQDFPDRGLPVGGLSVTDPAGIKIVASRDDLGNEIFIMYSTEEEIATV